jgi:hypothetical protein
MVRWRQRGRMSADVEAILHGGGHFIAGGDAGRRREKAREAVGKCMGRPPAAMHGEAQRRQHVLLALALGTAVAIKAKLCRFRSCG